MMSYDRRTSSTSIWGGPLVNVSALLLVLTVLLAGSQGVSGYELIPSALILAGALWAALLVGGVWIGRAAGGGPWQVAQAWLWASMVRVVAALAAVAGAIKIFDCDPGAVVICLGVLYLPTLFYEAIVVSRWMKTIDVPPLAASGRIGAETCP